MGCEQSSETKSTSPRWSSKVLPGNAEIDGEYRKEYNNSYQDVLDGQRKMTLVDPAVADELLQQYIKSEEKINRLERGDPLTTFYIKKSHLESVEEAIQDQQERIEATKKTEGDKERTGISTVKDILMEIGDKKPTKEEQEHLAGINKMEIALTELEMLHQEKAMTGSDIDDIQQIIAELKDEYELQDAVLEQLSLGNLSAEETQLQKELGEWEAKRIRVSDIFERWKEARALVGEACRQFSLALDKWKNIKDDTPLNQYLYGEELRDDLVTALQCLTNSKFYIKTNFPYCSKVEIAILEKAMTYMFIDMKTDERRLHAEGCYTAFQKRAVALYAWMDMTIQAIIDMDMKTATSEINERIKKLRDIRKTYFQQHFPTVAWREVELLPTEPSASYSLSDPESETTLKELDISQLAPLPTRDEIYGKPAGVIVEDYKSRLRDSIILNHERKKSVDKNIDDIISSRRHSLSELNMIEEDTHGLT